MFLGATGVGTNGTKQVSDQASLVASIDQLNVKDQKASTKYGSKASIATYKQFGFSQATSVPLADLLKDADVQHREYLRGALRFAIYFHAKNIFNRFQRYETTRTASLVDSITEGVNGIRLSETETETVKSNSTTEAKNYENQFVKPQTCKLMTQLSELISVHANVESQRHYHTSCGHVGRTDFALKFNDLVLLCEEDKSWTVDLMAKAGPMKCAIAQLGLEMKAEIELHMHNSEVIPDRFCGFLTNGCSWILAEQHQGIWQHSDPIQVFNIAKMELVHSGIDTVANMFLYAIESFSALSHCDRLQEDLDIDGSTGSGEDLNQHSEETSQTDINEEQNAEGGDSKHFVDITNTKLDSNQCLNQISEKENELVAAFTEKNIGDLPTKSSISVFTKQREALADIGCSYRLNCR